MPKFEKGNKLAKGGARPGAGRKPDWFKEEMQKLATTDKAVKFLKDCIEGEDVDEFITDQGECIPHRAKADTRIRAWEAVADRGFGRPTQQVHQTGTQGINLFQLIREAEEERGLPSSFDK